MQKVQDKMLAEVQGWCRGCRGGAGGAGRVQGRCRWCRGSAGYLHRLHLGKHNIRCREVQMVQAHLRYLYRPLQMKMWSLVTSGARMVIQNTYPKLSRIYQAKFELGGVKQFILANDCGIAVQEWRLVQPEGDGACSYVECVTWHCRPRCQLQHERPIRFRFRQRGNESDRSATPRLRWCPSSTSWLSLGQSVYAIYLDQSLQMFSASLVNDFSVLWILSNEEKKLKLGGANFGARIWHKQLRALCMMWFQWVRAVVTMGLAVQKCNLNAQSPRRARLCRDKMLE